MPCWPFLVLIIFSGLFVPLVFFGDQPGIRRQLHERHPPDAHAFLLGVHGGPDLSAAPARLPVLRGAGNLLFSQSPATAGYLIEISHPRLDSFGASLVNVAATAFMALILVVGIVVVAIEGQRPAGRVASSRGARRCGAAGHGRHRPAPRAHPARGGDRPADRQGIHAADDRREAVRYPPRPFGLIPRSCTKSSASTRSRNSSRLWSGTG